MFCTALYAPKSPHNVGTIVRSHVAFGGSEICIIGNGAPWEFGKRTQSFSRKLEKLCPVLFFSQASEFFDWCAEREYTPVALEISPVAVRLDRFAFPQRPALVLGNEAAGLPAPVLSRCRSVVRIPQFGPVGSLNLGISAGIAMYEFNRNRESEMTVVGSKFDGEREAMTGRRPPWPDEASG